jgi:2-octaprenylphenol hydroxylase
VNHDVVVVGGGLVGLTLAGALGREGVRVAVVEARAVGPPVREGFDLRTSAISPVSQRILEAVGAWGRIPPDRVGAFDAMHVWDRPGHGELHFDAADADLPLLGHIVENRELVFALDQAVAALDTVRLYRPATLQALHAGPRTVMLQLDGGRLEARLVAGADGARSRVRDLAGIEADLRPYEQEALVAVVRTAQPHGATAWQRFLVDGPVAFLPLPEGWCSVVWSTTPQHAHALEAMPEPAFCEALTEAFQARLGTVEVVAGRARFPLVRVQARRYLAPRVALLGDAAHTIHPLAGQGVNLGLLDQGVNLGLLDAAVLAEIVIDLLAAGRDPGLEGNLRRYERWRRGHNLLTGEIMTGFNRLFGSRLPALAAARNLGFALTNRAVPVKRLFIRYASGLAFDLPRIARRLPL